MIRVPADSVVTHAMQLQDIIREFEKREYLDAQGNYLPYRLLQPKSIDRGARYPLVLFLHGAGERGDDNARQVANGAERFAEAGNREQHPAFVVVPQCPAEDAWVDIWNDAPSAPLRSAREVLDLLAGEFPVDERRVYVTGVSMGGFGAWEAIERWPDYFAAAVPVCGGGDVSRARLAVHVPVWAFHGADDGVVDVGYSRDMVEAFRRAGGDPKYTEYPGVGHASWERVFRDPELFGWLFSQEKKAIVQRT